jgi:hypothetical protein
MFEGGVSRLAILKMGSAVSSQLKAEEHGTFSPLRINFQNQTIFSGTGGGACPPKNDLRSTGTKLAE